jgi:hypothetical protein
VNEKIFDISQLEEKREPKTCEAGPGGKEMTKFVQKQLFRTED